MFRHFIHTVIIGGLSGAILVLLVLPLAYRSNWLHTAQLIDVLLPNRTVIKEVQKTVVSVPAEDQSRPLFEKAKAGLVLVQLVRGGQPILSGTGLVATEDGLILVSDRLSPVGTASLQVWVNNQAVAAALINRNSKLGLALIRVEEKLPQVSVFSKEKLLAGDYGLIAQLAADGQTIQPALKKVMLEQVSAGWIALDAKLDKQWTGGVLIDGAGAIAGLLNSASSAIPAQVLEDFINQNLK